MADAPQAHPDDEIIERYAMNRLEEPELGEVEEHVLICEPCQDRVAEAEEFATVMRAAAANSSAWSRKARSVRRRSLISRAKATCQCWSAICMAVKANSTSAREPSRRRAGDRKSTRLNSSHT